jgi:hypothetical protein
MDVEAGCCTGTEDTAIGEKKLNVPDVVVDECVCGLFCKPLAGTPKENPVDCCADVATLGPTDAVFCAPNMGPACADVGVPVTVKGDAVVGLNSN